MRTRPLDRRTFLRGAAGVAVGLPVLEIMLNGRGTALATTGEPITPRYLVCFAGASLGGDGDPIHDQFVPDTVGPKYDLKTGTSTLANHGNIRDKITIVSGLRIPYRTGSGAIPLGGWAQDFHTQALGPLISGVRNQALDDYDVNGVTSDQVVADALGKGTTFRSLHYQVQASWYLTVSAPYGRDILSYRRAAGGALLPIPGQISPKAAYDSLFTSFVPRDDAEAAAKALELLKRQSVLDLVRSDYESLIPRLGRADQIRLEQHLDEIRTLEAQLAAIAPDGGPTCYQYPDPGADPPIGGAQEAVAGDQFDVNLGWSDETTRAERFADLVHMAFTCDLSRSIALLYTMAQSHLNAYTFTGQPYDLHELGHSGLGTEVFSAVHAWHLDLFGGLVARLRDTPEGDGTVLDSCAVVLLFEGGHGYDPGSGSANSTHSTENMAACVAGGAGGLVQGEHVVATGYHPVNVLNTAMHAVGVDQDLGEVEGEIPGLRR